MANELAIAVLGGFVGASAPIAVQILQARAAANERRELRSVDVIQEFASAATAWSQWLWAMDANERLTHNELMDENNARSRARQMAYQKLELHCSDSTYGWLKEVYEPAEQAVRDDAVPLLRAGGKLSRDARHVLSRYETVVQNDLVPMFRSELRRVQGRSRSWV